MEVRKGCLIGNIIEVQHLSKVRINEQLRLHDPFVEVNLRVFFFSHGNTTLLNKRKAVEYFRQASIFALKTAWH